MAEKATKPTKITFTADGYTLALNYPQKGSVGAFFSLLTQSKPYEAVDSLIKFEGIQGESSPEVFEDAVVAMKFFAQISEFFSAKQTSSQTS